MDGSGLARFRERRRRDLLASLGRAAAEAGLRPGTRVVVFGSWARGDWTGDSDLDVAVIRPAGSERSPDEAAALYGWLPTEGGSEGGRAGGEPMVRSLDIVHLSEDALARSGLRDAIAAGIEIDPGEGRPDDPSP